MIVNLVRQPAVVALLAIVAGSWAQDVNQDGVTLVVCAGDSNTDPNPQPTAQINWCERLAEEHPELVVVNYGLASTFAGAVPGYCPGYCGDGRLAMMRAREAEGVHPKADGVILAWGTNDIRHGATPQQVVDALGALRSGLLAENRRVAVLTIPPNFYEPHLQPAIDATNALLVDTGWDVVDSAAGLTVDDLAFPGIHLNQAGHDHVFAAIDDALL